MNSAPTPVTQRSPLRAWTSACSSALERVASRACTWADSRTKYPAVLMVFGAALATGVVGALMQYIGRCTNDVSFSPFALQVTFSAPTFTAIVNSVKDSCPVGSPALLALDTVFPVLYAIMFAFLAIWLHRWMRVAPDGAARNADDVKQWSALPGAMLVVLPALAAFFDIIVENPLLFYAARTVVSGGAAPTWAVFIGSLGAAIKWGLLGATIIGCVVALLRGPRGVVLWQARYSVLAVMLGAVPLLIVPQGQDILQRLIEGAYPEVRIGFGVLAIACAAIVNWFCARSLTRVRLVGDPSRRDPWYPFFERNIPRMLGVATLVVSALAFAHAAGSEAQNRFIALTVGAYIIGMALRERGRQAFGRPFAGWFAGAYADIAKSDALITDRLGRAVIGIIGALLMVIPDRVWPLDEFRFLSEPATREVFLLRFGAGLLLAVTWLLFLYVYFRKDFSAIRNGRAADLKSMRAEEQALLANGFPPGALPHDLRVRIGAALVVSVTFFLLFTYWTVPVARTLGPLVVLAATAANAVFFGSLAAYVCRKYRVPVVPIAIALAAVISSFNDNHAIRTTASQTPAASPTASPTASPQLAQRLDAWYAAQQSHRAPADTTSVPLVLVAASGGGLRAAYWTALTLATLQDRERTFADHVFAISGVSGGSVGGAYFVAMQRDLERGVRGDSASTRGTNTTTCRKELAHAQPMQAKLAPGDTTRARELTACVKRVLGDDFLSPALAKFVTADFTQWFVPVPIAHWDRAIALEKSFEESYTTAIGTNTLADGFTQLMQDSSAAAPVPALLLNTTHVETGRRFVTAPFADSQLFLDATYVHDALDADLPLSTAAHNSARFTYVSPAGRIERRDGISRGSLVDGGYFENSGLATLLDLHNGITAWRDARTARGDTTRLHIVVLYLCNDPRGCKRDIQKTRSLEAARGSAGEWFAPVRALLATRDARGALARQQVRRVVPPADFLQFNVCDSLPRVASSPAAGAQAGADTARTADIRKRARERVVDPPLGWLLSAQARRWMDSSLVGDRAVAESCPATNAAYVDQLVALIRR